MKKTGSNFIMKLFYTRKKNLNKKSSKTFEKPNSKDQTQNRFSLVYFDMNLSMVKGFNIYEEMTITTICAVFENLIQQFKQH